MNYSEIKENDIANGLGVRVSLFVSGCRNHCKGCFNECTWDFNAGKPFTDETMEQIIKALSYNYIQGLSVLGGDPAEEENQETVSDLISATKEILHKSVWLYTGYYITDLMRNGRKFTKYSDTLLTADVIVDGPFVLEQKDISLKYKGSRNQRIICCNSVYEEELKRNDIDYIPIINII